MVQKDSVPEYLIFPELHSPMLQRHILLSFLLQFGQSKIHETGGMRSVSQFGKFVRCFLKGEIGDQINISISSVAYNLKMDPVQAGIIFNLFYTSLKNMFCRKINYYPVSFLSKTVLLNINYLALFNYTSYFTTSLEKLLNFIR